MTQSSRWDDTVAERDAQDPAEADTSSTKPSLRAWRSAMHFIVARYRASRTRFLAFWLVLLALAAVYTRLHVGLGSLADPQIAPLLMSLRWHSIGIGALVGAALGLAGLLMQGLFRNPLADPSIIGVGAGAHLGGMIALTLGERALRIGATSLRHELVLPLGCLVGALAVMAVLVLVLRITRDTGTVLLMGVVLASFCSSLGALFSALVSERWQLLRAFLAFFSGDISGKGPTQLAIAAPLVLAGTLAAFTLGRSLDILQSGEAEAHTLGLDVRSVRAWIVFWTAVLVTAAVAVGGTLPFVGLMAPHFVRQFSRARHRQLVPLVALAGAVFVVCCDSLSVFIDPSSTIPLGGITGLLGAPLFALVLMRQRAFCY